MFGSQVSAVGYQVRVIGYGYGPEPEPAPEHLNLGPDGRDPGPENDFIPTDAMSSHPYRTADFDILTADIGHIHWLLRANLVS